MHRIGRTGRAGKTGVAITLVDWDELGRWEMIDKALSLNCPDPAETYSSSPHIYEELGIPTDATGTIGEPVKAKAKAKRSPDEKRISSADSEGRPAKTRTRTRRRTRGGEAATGHPEGTAPAAEGADAAPVTVSEDTTGEASSAGRRRRRRRPRKTETATAG